MSVVRTILLFVLATANACGGQSPVTQQPRAVQQPPAGPAEAPAACLASSVTIDKPTPGETHETSVTASGRVHQPCAETWIVVHSKGGGYYVQPRSTVDNDGRWLTTVRLGEAGQGGGERFEIVALANPATRLEEGQTLSDWPSAQARSAVVALTREVVRPVPPPPAPAANCKLTIVEPAHGGRVIDRPEVRVQAEKSCSLTSVWVVVHPTDVSTYWVQPRLSEREGVWKTKIHAGRPGRDWNASFELKAFGNPNESLHEGQELPYWPDASVASELIEVTKGR